MNHEQIKTKIEAIPGICKEGKAAITELLKEFGYVPPIEKLRISPGNIVKGKITHRFGIATSDSRVQYLTSPKPGETWELTSSNDNFDFIATNLKEALDKGLIKL